MVPRSKVPRLMVGVILSVFEGSGFKVQGSEFYVSGSRVDGNCSYHFPGSLRAHELKSLTAIN